MGSSPRGPRGMRVAVERAQRDAEVGVMPHDNPYSHLSWRTAWFQGLERAQQLTIPGIPDVDVAKTDRE